MAERATKGKIIERTGAVAPFKSELATWLEGQFRGETPNEINAFPLTKYKGMWERGKSLYHYDVKANEKVGASRAAELADLITGELQADCDVAEKKSRYEVEIVDNGRGGKAAPIVKRLMLTHGLPVRPGDDDDDGDDLSPGQRMLLESTKLIHDEKRDAQNHEGKVVGDTLVTLLEALKDERGNNRELTKELLAFIRSERDDRRALAQIAMDDRNYDEDRKDRQAERRSKNLKDDMIRGTVQEIIKQIAAVAPGFGALILDSLSDGRGKPALPPTDDAPKLTDGAAPTALTTTATNGTSPERDLVSSILDAIEAKNLGEVLFGRTDEATDTLLEPGVFTTAQGDLLVDVKFGKRGADDLAVLASNSGKPESMSEEQIALAMPILLKNGLIADILRLKLMIESKAAKA